MALTQDDKEWIAEAIQEYGGYNYQIDTLNINNPQDCNFNINSGGFGDTDPDEDGEG